MLTNMHGIYHCSIRELSGSGRLFLYPSQPEMTRKEKGNGRKTQTLANRELQGKVGKRFLSDGKVRPQAVSEKIILAALRYFSRKPCLSGSICRWALVVQRAAKARVFTVKN